MNPKMKEVFFIFCFILSFSSFLAAIQGKCLITYTQRLPTKKVILTCTAVNFNNNLMEDVLNGTEINDAFYGGHKAYVEIASSIIQLFYNFPIGNITIGHESFAEMPNLESFRVENSDPVDYLVISPDAFQKTPNLRTAHIFGRIITGDTVEALASLKNQLNQLNLKSNALPEKDFITEIPKFTNLTSLVLFNCTQDHPVPVSIFRNSALSLENINIQHCPIKNLSKTLLQNLSNLIHLEWSNSNITSIDNGGFDDLINLEYLLLADNRIKELPDGLFEKLRKLKIVRIKQDGEILNLSRNNFTHVDDFEGFQLFGLN